MGQTPPPPDNAELATRVRDLELLLASVLAAARRHPVGRKVLTYLGLS